MSVSSSPSGSDDLSAKLWDVSTGQCIYGIQTHTCATVKFDEQKLVTGSFDNTMACWDWSSGAKIQQFRGHTGAGETHRVIGDLYCEKICRDPPIPIAASVSGTGTNS